MPNWCENFVEIEGDKTTIAEPMKSVNRSRLTTKSVTVTGKPSGFTLTEDMVSWIDDHEVEEDEDLDEEDEDLDEEDEDGDGEVEEED